MTNAKHGTVCNCGVGDTSKAAHGFECPKRKRTKREKLRAARARLGAAAALVLTVGCAPDPADSVSFSGFSPAQLEVAQDVLDQWCDAVGWCPVVTRDGELHVKLEATEAAYAKHQRHPKSGGFNDGAGMVYMNPVVTEDLELLWTALAHELGHEGVHGHVETGLMAAYPEVRACIDQAAVDAWCAGAGCDADAHETCYGGDNEGGLRKAPWEMEIDQ